MNGTDGQSRKPFNCRRCGEKVAETNGIEIYFGLKPVPMNPLRIKFICPNCKAEVEWHSIRRNGNVLTESTTSSIT